MLLYVRICRKQGTHCWSHQDHPFKVCGLETLEIWYRAASSVTSWEVKVSEMAAAGPGLLWSAWWFPSHRERKFTCVLYDSRGRIVPVLLHQTKLTQTKALYISLLLHQQQSFVVSSLLVALAVELAMSSCGTSVILNNAHAPRPEILMMRS